MSRLAIISTECKPRNISSSLVFGGPVSPVCSVDLTSDHMTTAHSTYRTLSIDFLGALGNALVDLRGFSTLAFELIQNADDADGATEMAFDVRDDALVVVNNGFFTDCDDQDSPECPWMAERGTRCDFHSFRLVQGGTKRSRDDMTGAFGIGFTSVYQITDKPELSSGKRRWVISLEEESRRIAEDILEPAHEGTKLVLPWARDASTLRERLRAEPVSSDAPQRMLDELLTAVPQAMLFLRKIKRIEIRNSAAIVRSFSREGSAEEVVVTDGTRAQTWHVLTSVFDQAAAELRASYSQIEPKRRAGAAVAIAAERDGRVGSDGLLYAVLPTQQRTPLDFHVNADFYPNTNRKGIVLETDYQSKWNRAALSAAAAGLADSLDSLPQRLGHQRLWDVLASAHAASQAAARQEEDEVFALFWQKTAEAAREAPTIYTSDGEWRRPRDTFLLVQPDEEQALPLLEALELPVTHPDLRSALYNLRSELGIPFLDAEAIVGAIEGAGLGLEDDEIPEPLRDERLRDLLWDELERLLTRQSQRSQADQEKVERVIASSPTAPVLGGRLRVWDHTYFVRGEATTSLFGDLFPFLDVEVLGERQSLQRLCGTFTRPAAARAIASLEEHVLDQLDELQVLRWFATAPHELLDDTDGASALASLPLFPSGDGFHPLDELLVPGGFIDPLGLTKLVNVDAVANFKQLLEALDARKLTFDDYLREHVPRRLEAEPLSVEKHAQLLDLLASRLSEFEDDEALRRRLGETAVVLCSDGRARPAADVYTRTVSVAKALGAEAKLAEPSSPAVGRLYDWLGVADQPRAADVIARVEVLTSNAPTKDAADAVARIVDVLGTVHPRPLDRRETEEWSKLFALEYGELTTMPFLPAAGDRTTWYEPDEIYRRSREYLFSTQATFLGIPRAVEDRNVHVLELLGVSEEPTIQQVVQHLRHCALQGENVNNQVYTFLNQRAGDEAARSEIERLRAQPCIQVGDGSYVGGWQVFWHDNTLAPFRQQLAEEHFSPWKRLLDLIGVKDEPSHEDAFRLLREFSVSHGTGEPIRDDDVATVLHRCWQILDRDLAEDQIHAADIRREVAQLKCVPDATGVLAVPRQIFVEDLPGLREAFSSEISERCIARPQASWHALKAAGVRGLREAAHDEIAPADAEVDLAIRTLLNERRAEAGRAVDATLEGADIVRAMAWYDAIEFRSAPELTVRWTLDDNGTVLATEVRPVAALYSTKNQALYVRKAGDQVESWSAVAREIAGFISETADPSRIAALLKEILAARTPGEAAQELDELGVPRLQRALPDARDLSPAEFGGAILEDDQAVVANEIDQQDVEVDEPDEGESGGDDAESEPELDQPAAGPAVPAPGGSGPGAGPSDGGTGGERPSASASGSPGAGTEDTPPGSAKTGTSEPRPPGNYDRGRWLVLVSGKGGDGRNESSSAAGRRSAIDAAGIAEVLRCEREAGRDPQEMPHSNPGYDVTSKDADGEIVRYIEVKSISTAWQDAVVQLTGTQFAKAQELRDLYWLYVVENAGSPHVQVRAVQDPAGAATRFVFDHGWKERAESDASAPVREAGKIDRHLAAVTPILRAVVDCGGETPKVPYDLRGSGAPRRWTVDAAWPDRRVAVVGDAIAEREIWLEAQGWAVLTAGSFDDAAILVALGLDD
jgi:hypothetical protein